MMTDWGRGGPTGSLNRWVRKEVREQLRSNPLARRARYSLPIRSMRVFFSVGTFWRFLSRYLLLDLAFLNIEGFWQIWAPFTFPSVASGDVAAEALRSIPSYLIGAQVGILSVISLALALVTLIAQRDEASTDVQVYYHESLFFEITASCLALVAILCVQLFWPLQYLFHLLGGGGRSPLFKLALLGIHLVWFLINLAAVAHFISVTFRFVQRKAREELREAFTANIVVPKEMADRVRETVYSMAGMEAIPVDGDAINPVCFGMGMHEPYIVELKRRFVDPAQLKEVHIRVAHWAIRRWYKRCRTHAVEAIAKGEGRDQPRLWFVPRIKQTLQGEVEWCRREGGVPLDPLERLLLRFAFRFERVKDAD